MKKAYDRIRLALYNVKHLNGGRSSAVEHWIVVPGVAGSNPVGRPLLGSIGMGL